MSPRTPGWLQHWMLLFLCAAPFARANDALGEADKAAGDFIDAQIETARVETDWRSQRELLETMVAAAKERAASLEEKRDLTKAKTAKDREEIEALRSSRQKAADELEAFETRLKILSDRLIALKPALPPHLADAFALAYRSLGDSELPAGERIQLAMNLLNRCGQFNRTITVSEDVLSLEGEPPEKSYATIYWGLSHGYALDRASRKAWLGRPGTGGWQWQAKPEAFARIASLIAIAHDQEDPAFVPVPAVVTQSLTIAR